VGFDRYIDFYNYCLYLVGSKFGGEIVMVTKSASRLLSFMACRKDGILDGILVFVAILVVGYVIMMLFALPAIFGARDNSFIANQVNSMASCRSQYKSAVDSALAQLQIESSQLQIANAQLQTAVTRGKSDSVVAESLVAVSDAREAILSAVEKAERAVEFNAESLSLSRRDTEAFLAKCERDHK
jgi:hypothetical protein